MQRPFPIVGIGASAGGLNALELFFEHLPSDIGMAFVVVTHLASGHTSIMPEILQKKTRLKVIPATDQSKVQPGHVYVNGPDQDVAINDRTLQLMDINKDDTPHLPVDFFLRTLAADCGDYAACLILSGTGTDGTLGAREIKAGDGMVMVQEPGTAKYNGMPNSAIQTGVADFVLAPEKMPAVLLDYFSTAFRLKRQSDIDQAHAIENVLGKACLLLRQRTGHDFNLYKKSTLTRRLARRMSIQQIEDPDRYVAYLRKTPPEVDALFQELLIGVTSFFRDPDAFDCLKREVKTRLLPMLSNLTSCRVWVPGCSTGEEVYSLAILFHECFDQSGRDLGLQVFGTDIDERAIDRAREGVYPASIASDLSPERLDRFLSKDAESFTVRKAIRDSAVFSLQNVLRDPPFSRLHAISCRNLLIYLDTRAQEKLLPLLHYSLLPGGILFLGSSETVGKFSNLFEALDPKGKIYRRREDAAKRGTRVDFPSGLPSLVPASLPEQEPRASIKYKDPSGLLMDLVLAQYTPACFLVDSQGNILHFVGSTGEYMDPQPGRASLEITSLIKYELRSEMRSALLRARSSGEEVVRERVHYKAGSTNRNVKLSVRPLLHPPELEGFFLVVLQNIPGKPEREAEGHNAKGSEASALRERVEALEQDLKYSFESNQTIIEELETTNEELKSTNEELQSANEELQSTNEELESSKEEQQSLNEEMQTVNAELESKVEELSSTQDFMKNLLASIRVPAVFVDNDLNVKRFTPQATRLIHLIDGDVGRRLDHVVHDLVDCALTGLMRSTLDSLNSIRRKVQSNEGKWYQMHIMPYRSSDNRLEGAVITFMDITELENALGKADELNRGLELALGNAQAIIDTVREPLLVLEEDLSVVSANGSFYYLIGVTPEQVEGSNLFKLGNGQWDSPGLRELLKKVAASREPFEGFEITTELPELGATRMRLNGRTLVQPGTAKARLLLAMEIVPDEPGASDSNQGGTP